MAMAKRGDAAPYDRAFEGISALIETGDYRGGEALPPERDLCERFGVSRATLRSALATLTSLGLVEARRGAGTYVSRPRPVEAIHRAKSYSDIVRAAGMTPSSRLIEQRLAPASAVVAEHLSIEVGAPVLQLCRIRLMDARPARIDTTYVNAGLFPGIERFDFGVESLFDIFTSQYGRRPAHRTSKVEICRLGRLEAALLDSEPNRPAFLLTDLVMTETMEVIEWSEMRVLPESCVITNDFSAPGLDATASAPATQTSSDVVDGPAHVRVRTKVLSDIMTGVYPPGSALPGEIELARVFSVSRKTVRKALDTLVDQGFVRRIRGKGTFSLGAFEHGRSRPLGFREREALQHRTAQVRVLGALLRPAGPAYARLLGVEPQDTILRLRRLNISDGEPVGIETVFIPQRLFPRIDRLDFAVFSLYEVYARSGHVVTSSTDTISVVELSTRDARLLHADPGDPALFFSTVGRDSSGTPIEHTISLETGNRAVYEIRT